MEDYYELLGVERNATQSDIKAAYRRKCKEHHPDLNGGSEGARKMFLRIKEAYDQLSNPILRKIYDAQSRTRFYEKKDREKEEWREKYKGIDTVTKLEILIAFATVKRSYNPSLAVSFLNQLSEGRKLSEKQLGCIDNMLNGFQVDVDFWLDEEKRNAAVEKFMESQK